MNNGNTLSISKSKKPSIRLAHNNERKPKAPTHDVILGGIRKRGETIFIQVGDYEYKGEITQFDKFTITIREDSGKLRTVYKHAIESFSAE